MHLDLPQRLRRATRLFAAIAILVVSACASELTAPKREDESIQTDRLNYEARFLSGSGTYTRYGFTVVAQFRNTTSRPVYLGRCYPDSPGPIYGVLAIDSADRWGAGYSGAWACVGHGRQFEVLPGATRIDTLRIAGPNAWDGVTKEPFGVLEGRFRLLYDLRYSPDECSEGLSDKLRQSNEFTVDLIR